jgi:molybdopterin-guanine dinucleotide biosynthesis protein A
MAAMAERDAHSRLGPPPLKGLVLAGGLSSRLGRDKGSLDYHGVPQARWALELLAPFCVQTFASIRAEQAELPAYRGLPVILDARDSAGPATGLLQALQHSPGAAWLAIAADMPLLTPPALAQLLAHRDPAALATAYRHRDGTPEPLCAIWEPAVEAHLTEGGPRGVSLRRLLETGPARLIPLANDDVLTSVNTAIDDARVRRLLAGAADAFM